MSSSTRRDSVFLIPRKNDKYVCAYLLLFNTSYLYQKHLVLILIFKTRNIVAERISFTATILHSDLYQQHLSKLSMKYEYTYIFIYSSLYNMRINFRSKHLHFTINQYYVIYRNTRFFFLYNPQSSLHKWI